MCGIAGELRFDGRAADGEAVRRMLPCLASRGPDGAGFWTTGPVALGHRRLKIIDLSEAGGQPMTDEELGLTLVFNGCVYNYQQLREELRGFEAGQSGVGDIFAHYVPPTYTHEQLTELAARQRPGEHGLLVLDWHSGNRSVLVDHELSGLVLGETLATRPEDVYRAVIEATAYGTRVIVDAFEAAGAPVREFVVAGGLMKNALVMQIYADVLKRPLSVIGSDQGPALGSAIHAAAAAGAYPDVRSAAAAMGRRREAVRQPDPAASAVYDELFAEYVRLHDYFGRGGNTVMRKLRAIRRDAKAAR